jgi:citrate lyase subunit beta/citryl-CoA lyase
MTAATYLYVPGDRPDRFAKALASGADAVILDLEDAVHVRAKSAARAAVREHLATSAGSVERWVRVNAGELGALDLEAIRAQPGLTGVVVPKADRDALAAVRGIPAIGLVETAAGFLDLPALAASGVVALAIGEVDLCAELGIQASEDEHELWPLRMQVVVASAAAGCEPPIGPVHTATRDTDGLHRSTIALKCAGFGARQVIHPAQVPIVSAALAPSAEELEAADRLLRGAQNASNGSWTDDAGRMIDEAVLRSARRVLDRAQSRASRRL